MAMTDDEIEAEAIRLAQDIWNNRELHLPYTYCTECDDGDRMLKRPCVCDMMDMSALCARHWIMRKIDQMKKERDQQKITIRVVTPKLDVADFARL